MIHIFSFYFSGSNSQWCSTKLTHILCASMSRWHYVTVTSHERHDIPKLSVTWTRVQQLFLVRWQQRKHWSSASLILCDRFGRWFHFEAPHHWSFVIGLVGGFTLKLRITDPLWSDWSVVSHWSSASLILCDRIGRWFHIEAPHHWSFVIGLVGGFTLKLRITDPLWSVWSVVSHWSSASLILCDRIGRWFHIEAPHHWSFVIGLVGGFTLKLRITDPLWSVWSVVSLWSSASLILCDRFGRWFHIEAPHHWSFVIGLVGGFTLKLRITDPLWSDWSVVSHWSSASLILCDRIGRWFHIEAPHHWSFVIGLVGGFTLKLRITDPLWSDWSVVSHWSSASLILCDRIGRWFHIEAPHHWSFVIGLVGGFPSQKGSNIMRKAFPCHDVIIHAP